MHSTLFYLAENFRLIIKFPPEQIIFTTFHPAPLVDYALLPSSPVSKPAADRLKSLHVNSLSYSSRASLIISSPLACLQ